MSETKVKTIAPFGIEANAPRNGDIMLQAIRGCRLRGRLDATKPTVVNSDEPDIQVVPEGQASSLGQLPKVPGMEIHVHPTKLTYAIEDPLHDNEELCEKLVRGLERSHSAFRPKKIRGVAPQTGKLDVHQMKTLVREMVRLIESDHAAVANGVVPSLEDVDALPGNYLQNSGSDTWNQPKYEKDMEGWVDRLTRAGV